MILNYETDVKLIFIILSELKSFSNVFNPYKAEYSLTFLRSFICICLKVGVEREKKNQEKK